MSVPFLLLLPVRNFCLVEARRPSSRLAFSTAPIAARRIASYSSSRPQYSRCFSAVEAVNDDNTILSSTSTHIVDGIVCREIPIELPVVGVVTVLEATAESQESLVDMALALDDDELREGEQKLSAGDPYGAVLWPAAWAVASYLLTSEGITTDRSKKEDLVSSSASKRPLTGLSILELGTGTGLVSIAAALGGAKVLATDYEPLALTLTEYAAKSFHGDEIVLPIELQLLDMCNFDTPLPLVDLVVAADIMYEPKTGIAMAHRAVEALKQGSRVLVGDSPGRPGRPAFLKALKELGVSDEAIFQDTIGRTCSGPRHELICGKGSTSVSATPKELPVAIMDLNPSMLS